MSQAKRSGRRNEGYDAITAYLRDIARYPLLSTKEEQGLFRALDHARAVGDLMQAEKLFEEAVNSNLRLAVLIAFQHSIEIAEGAISKLDLIQQANLGLIRAVEKFEVTRGNKFSTYASYWIYQSVLRYLQSQGRPVRVPFNLQGEVKKVRVISAQMKAEGRREPTEAELSRLRWKGDKLERFQRLLLLASLGPVSLDDVLSPDDTSGTTVHEVLASQAPSPLELCSRGEASDKVRRAMAECLSERQRQIIELRFGFEDGPMLTLEEVGIRLGISRERVRQIEATAIRLLVVGERGRELRQIHAMLESF